MSTIDIDALLCDVDSDMPCGPNLEYDPDFVALEYEALGKPEAEYGDTMVAAVDPDWKRIRRLALELLERSRDLRLAAHLVRSSLAMSGIGGLADAIVLIEQLLEQRWDSVHPQLDPDDDFDPTLRINSLAMLGDTVTLVRELKLATLVSMPGLGPLTLRMLEVANGEVTPGADHENIALGSIESAIADVDPDRMAAAVDDLGRALAGVENIERILMNEVGSAQALNLDALARPLRRAHEFLARLQGAGEVGQGDDGGDGSDTPAVAGAARAGINGEVTSRDDVVRMLDKVVQYYARHEPSSPIPILLERAKRLVSMNFFELMQNLAPDGIAQLSVIRGPDDSEESASEDDY